MAKNNGLTAADKANLAEINLEEIKQHIDEGSHWNLDIKHGSIEKILPSIISYLREKSKDRQSLIKALRAFYWQIIIAKGYGTEPPKLKKDEKKLKKDEKDICVFTREIVTALISECRNVLINSGFNISPKDIFEYEDHLSMNDLFDDMLAYYLQDSDVLHSNYSTNIVS